VPLAVKRRRIAVAAKKKTARLVICCHMSDSSCKQNSGTVTADEITKDQGANSMLGGAARYSTASDELPRCEPAPLD